MDAGGPKGKAKSDINVTPLIDIVLVLLIVFIVMVPGLTKAEKVVPPQVVENPPKDQPPPTDVPVVVTIDHDGNYLLQQDKVDIKDLKEKVLDAVKKQPLTDRKVILKVDEDVAFQYAVNALDVINQASEQVKKDTLANPVYQGVEGTDIKVPITIKKKA